MGWLLGWAVSPSGDLVHEGDRLEIGHDCLAFDDELYQLAGRWIFISLIDQPRLYLDSGGSLAVVYDESLGRVASTTSLLRWGDPYTFSDERYERRTLRPNEFFPGGLTSDPGARRLLPNHFLDLDGWKAVRHWPLGQIDRVAEFETEPIVLEMYQAVANVIDSLARRQKLILPLTAGRDSRMVMAAARNSIDRCEFVTFQYSGFSSTDIGYARVAKKKFGLSQSSIRVPLATDEDKAKYLALIGYDANEGKTRDFQLAAGLLPFERGWVTGFAGEVGRAFYWGKSNGQLDTADLLTALRLPETHKNVAAIDAWRAGLPAGDAEQTLDLMYIELRLGCWASPQLYGVAPFKLNVIPLNQRPVFEAMLRLPVDYRREQKLAVDFINIGWGALATLPFGRPPGMGGFIQSRLEFVARANKYALRLLRRRMKLLRGMKF